jgi:arsenite methyltransferase
MIHGILDVLIVDMKADINLYKQTLDSCPEDTCCAPKKSVRIPAANFADVDFNEWVGESFLRSVSADRGC